MKLRKTVSLMLVSTALALVPTSAFAMVGGHVNPPGASRFPATVNIDGTCTGAKIGKRSFLTAAHCVFNHEARMLDPRFNPGSNIRVTNDPSAQLGSFQVLEVERTIPDPHYLSGCTAAPCNVEEMRRHGADVALIIVKQETPNTPIAKISYGRLTYGTPIILTGFGLEDYSTPLVRVPSDPLNYPAGRLSYFNSVAYDDRLPAGHGWTPIGTDFFYTMGRAADPSHAGLAPGDSGGPVYLDDGIGNTVVGVNMADWLGSLTLGISGYVFHGHSGLQTVGFWMAGLIR